MCYPHALLNVTLKFSSNKADLFIQFLSVFSAVIQIVIFYKRISDTLNLSVIYCESFCHVTVSLFSLPVLSGN